MDHQPNAFLGLMSGTSCDGVDAAWIDTDGHSMIRPRGFFFVPYPDDLRTTIRSVFGLRDRTDPVVMALEHRITRFQADATLTAMQTFGVDAAQIRAIGFHGQTITHDPGAGLTIQLGDGELLRALTGIPVVYDFRSADVAAGGQGAPLIPVYHQALVRGRGLRAPVAIVNIGGVANITWIDPERPDRMLAFDTGPGNALMDDCMRQRMGKPFDHNGDTAAHGQAQRDRVDSWLQHPYFALPPPKSLDRGSYDSRGSSARDVAIWDVSACDSMTTPDALATLALFTARALAMAAHHFPAPVTHWVLCGGGRHNTYLVQTMRACVPYGSVMDCDEWGWNGDAIEAQGFAYLATRVLRGDPISFPGTTGAPRPLTGGRVAS